jgi:hypothetical protein
MLRDAMKLEGWVAVIPLLLVLLLAELGSR